MTTFAQLQARGLSFLKAQVGKGYSEDPGQSFGPNTYDCQGLAYCTYKAAANLVTGPGIGLIGSRAQFELLDGQDAAFGPLARPRPVLL